MRYCRRSLSLSWIWERKESFGHFGFCSISQSDLVSVTGYRRLERQAGHRTSQSVVSSFPPLFCILISAEKPNGLEHIVVARSVTRSVWIEFSFCSISIISPSEAQLRLCVHCLIIDRGSSLSPFPPYISKVAASVSPMLKKHPLRGDSRSEIYRFSSPVFFPQWKSEEPWTCLIFVLYRGDVRERINEIVTSLSSQSLSFSLSLSCLHLTDCAA